MPNRWNYQKYNKIDRLTILIGFIILASITGIFLVLGSKKIFIKDYYYLNFEVNFLEGVSTGSKIRFNGSVIIGEVEDITYKNFKNHVYAKIKKGFYIPKRGSKVVIKTWGYLGQKYIDILLDKGSSLKDVYTEKEAIPILEPLNLNTRLQYLELLLKEDKVNHLSLLEEKVLGVQSNIIDLRSSYYMSPELTIDIHTKISNFNHLVSVFTNSLKETDEYFHDLEENTKKSIYNLKVGIPIYTRKVKEVLRFLRYTPTANASVSNKYFYYEELYETILLYSDIINTKLATWNRDPNTMFSE